MKMNKTAVIFTAAVALSILSAISVFAQTLETKSINGSAMDHSQVALAIDQSGLVYKMEGRKRTDDSLTSLWSLEIKPNESTTIPIFVKADGDVVMVYVNVGMTPENISQELKNKIAEISNMYYLIKAGYDSQVIYIRIDSLIYNFDGAILLNHINRILRISEKEVQSLATFLPAPEPTK